MNLAIKSVSDEISDTIRSPGVNNDPHSTYDIEDPHSHDDKSKSDNTLISERDYKGENWTPSNIITIMIWIKH